MALIFFDIDIGGNCELFTSVGTSEIEFNKWSPLIAKLIGDWDNIYEVPTFKSTPTGNKK